MSFQLRELHIWLILSRRIVLTEELLAPTPAPGEDQGGLQLQLQGGLRDGAQLGQGGEQDSHRQPAQKDGADHLCKRIIIICIYFSLFYLFVQLWLLKLA